MIIMTEKVEPYVDPNHGWLICIVDHCNEPIMDGTIDGWCIKHHDAWCRSHFEKVIDHE